MLISDWSSDVCSSDLRAHRAHPRSEFLDNERPGSDGLMEVVRLALDNGKWERAERNGNVHIGLMPLQDDGIGSIGLGVLEVSRKLAHGGQNPFFLMAHDGETDAFPPIGRAHL